MLAAAIAAPKISFETFAMISFSASGLCCRRAGDWIKLPQIPSAFLNTSRAALHGEARRIAAKIAKLPELVREA
jgi:hypothetical protein